MFYPLLLAIYSHPHMSNKLSIKVNLFSHPLFMCHVSLSPLLTQRVAGHTRPPVSHDYQWRSSSQSFDSQGCDNSVKKSFKSLFSEKISVHFLVSKLGHHISFCTTNLWTYLLLKHDPASYMLIDKTSQNTCSHIQ